MRISIPVVKMEKIVVESLVLIGTYRNFLSMNCHCEKAKKTWTDQLQFWCFSYSYNSLILKYLVSESDCWEECTNNGRHSVKGWR